MNRRLLILNLALVLAVGWTGYRLRTEWVAAKAREAAALNRRIKPAPSPALTPLPQTPAVLASSYAQIAQKMLFDRSRNPDVVIEVPAPPPPKPQPPLPGYKGMMNFGDGPIAIMTKAPNAALEEVRPGQPIGEFKLVDVTSQEITLEWEGKVIRKSVEELLQRVAAEAPQSAASNPLALGNAPPPPPVVKTPTGPGSDTGRGFKTCNPNDSMPAGTVSDGYIKVVVNTPFGPSCRWDPVR